jgi:hypothetical protein
VKVEHSEITAMDHPSEELDLPTPRGLAAKVLPLVLVLVIPLAFGVWWWSSREVLVDSPPAESVAADPWEIIQETIYPQGRIETIEHIDEFSYLYIRFMDADRWVATPAVKFKTGDTVQVEVAPLAVKQNFKAKALGRQFPKIVLVGNGGVKLIQAAASDERSGVK